MAVRAITALVTGPAVLAPVAVPAVPILDLRCSRLVLLSVLPAATALRIAPAALPRIALAATARLLTAPAVTARLTLLALPALIAAPLVAAIPVVVAHPVIGDHGLVTSPGVSNRWLLHHRIATKTP